jgi:hypothetical protein
MNFLIHCPPMKHFSLGERKSSVREFKEMTSRGRGVVCEALSRGSLSLKFQSELFWNINI